MKHLFSAGIILYRIENEQLFYLLLKHSYDTGHWDFSKGKIEEGETKEDAALRELQEETGLSSQIEPEFEESFSYIFHDHDGQLAQKTVSFFVGQANANNVILSHEHTDCAWLPYKDALEKLTYDNAKKILKKVHKYVKSRRQQEF